MYQNWLLLRTSHEEVRVPFSKLQTTVITMPFELGKRYQSMILQKSPGCERRSAETEKLLKTMQNDALLFPPPRCCIRYKRKAGGGDYAKRDRP